MADLAELPQNRKLHLTVGFSALLMLGVIWWAGHHHLFANLSQLSLAVVIGVVVLVLANLLVGSFRFWRILNHQGMGLPWRVALRANLAGLVAGLVVISLFGQVWGRQARLREFGITSVAVAGLAAYERAVVTLVSGTMAVFGLIYLMGRPVLNQILASAPFIQITLVVALAALMGMLIGGSHFDRQLLHYLRSWALYRRVLEIVGITLVNHLLMLSAFVLAIHAFAPGLGISELFAAAAIISFAASIPISANGWGVREITAVFVLRPLGVGSGHAAAASVTAGLCSTLAILAVAPLALRREARRTSVSPSACRPTASLGPVHDLERVSAWVLSMICAILVFFQMHVTFPGASIATDLNLADPFAILALAAVSLTAMTRKRMPLWRVRGFNRGLLAISLMLVFAFLHGVPDIGVTQWALVTRLLGWLVLLSYLAAGYLVVAVWGHHGLRRFAQTMVATGAVVVLVDAVIRLAALSGWPIPIPENFQGYAGNRNAFAFQMVVCLAWILAYANEFRRHLVFARGGTHFNAWKILFALVLLGLYLSSSRAGWIVSCVLLVSAWLYRLAPRRDLYNAAVLAGLLTLILHGTSQWISHISSSPSVGSVYQLTSPISARLASPISTEFSNTQHLLSMEKGLKMWWSAPLLGAGLGAFIAHSAAWFGRPLVVHSTPIWILAEMGLVGFLVFGSVFYILAQAAWRHWTTEGPSYRALAFVLLGFGLFCQVHEVFYQRIFWLALGAILASPSSWAEPRSIAARGEHQNSSLPPPTER
ncbi:MAG: lysylphosphatidylglycerol synthase domain-containing protein [Acidiferrobacteraceae bacterium]